MADDNLHVLITGDMAFFYDRNAFWHNYPLPNLRIIILNNHGGAIFGMIDGPQGLKETDEFFITRQSNNASALATEYGFEYKCVSTNTDAANELDKFFSAGESTRILEFDSTSTDAQQVFFRFKDKMKKLYESEI
jgi:2-succinyl-5-enolpyruvyl-6-hydroxy-3-cyclohexene-1-carboxylate synthase